MLEDLKDSGVRDISIILGDICPEKVKEYYSNGSNFGVKIYHTCQSNPKGIAHAVGLCEEFYLSLEGFENHLEKQGNFVVFWLNLRSL